MSLYGSGPGGGMAAESQKLTNVTVGSKEDKKRKRDRAARKANRQTSYTGDSSFDTSGRRGYNPPPGYGQSGQGVGSTTAPGQTIGAAGRDAAAQGLKSPNPLTNLGGAYGTLSPQGQTWAAYDPTLSYGTYFSDLGSGSNTADFYASYFDPTSLGIAAGMGDAIGTSNANVVAFGKSIADMMSGQQGLGQYLDPHTLVANVLTSAASVNAKDVQSGAINAANPLASLATMPPQSQITTLTDILQGALASVMPQDSLQSYIATLKLIARGYIDQVAHMPIEQVERSGMNVAKYLMQKLGPDFGLGASIV